MYLQNFEQYIVQPKQRTLKRANASSDDSTDDENSDDNGTSMTQWRDRYLNFVHPRTKPVVARLQYMSPDHKGAIWFLRLLLLHEPATSSTRIRTVNGLLQETFEHAARAMGLVHGVEEYTIYMPVGSHWVLNRQIITSAVQNAYFAWCTCNSPVGDFPRRSRRRLRLKSCTGRCR